MAKEKPPRHTAAKARCRKTEFQAPPGSRLCGDSRNATILNFSNGPRRPQPLAEVERPVEIGTPSPLKLIRLRPSRVDSRLAAEHRVLPSQRKRSQAGFRLGHHGVKALRKKQEIARVHDFHMRLLRDSPHFSG